MSDTGEIVGIDFGNMKFDDRPKLKGWAPGGYIGKCSTCKESFIGDKRAITCADCAYGV